MAEASFPTLSQAGKKNPAKYPRGIHPSKVVLCFLGGDWLPAGPSATFPLPMGV